MLVLILLLLEDEAESPSNLLLVLVILASEVIPFFEAPNCHPGRGRVARAPYRRHYPMDVYTALSARPDDFLRQCNFTIDEFDDLHAELKNSIRRPRNVQGKFKRLEQAVRKNFPCFMNTENRLLMVLIALASGGKLKDIAARFGTSMGIVHLDLHHIIPIICRKLVTEIEWPSVLMRQGLRALTPAFPSVIGALDATTSEIRRPIRNERQYYRGDKPYHGIIHQMIVDNSGCILNVDGPALGRTADVAVYRRSAVGENPGLFLSAGECLLADGGYPGNPEIIIPPTAPERKGNPLNAQYHREIQKHRVIVEHVFGRIQLLWKITHHKFPFSRSLQDLVFRACCLLTNRIGKLRGYLRR